MLAIPVPKKAGRDLLDGDGNFELSTDKDAWASLFQANAPFTRAVGKVAEARFGAATTRDFRFGRADGFVAALKLKAGGSHRVLLLWPGEDDDQLRAGGVAPGTGEYYLRLVVNAEGEADASLPFPTGPLSTTTCINAGGRVEYERWIRASADSGARGLLLSLYRDIRLPQQATTLESAPAAGEVLISRIGTYLKVAAKTRWGYSLTGTRDIDVPRLSLDLNQRLRVVAEASCSVNLAGEYQLEAREGQAPGWVRFVVRKSRAAETRLAADLSASGGWKLIGLPSSADDLLSRLFGTNADRLLEILEKASTFTDLKQLEAAAGKMLKGLVHQYSDRVLGIVLTNDNVKAVLARLNDVGRRYASIDGRILALYHQVIARGGDELDRMAAALEWIAGMGDASELVTLSGKPELAPVADSLKQIIDGGLDEVLRSHPALVEARTFAGKASRFLRGQDDADVKAWIDLVEEKLRLDPLFERLSKVDTPEKIRTLADEQLRGLVESLTGRAFDQLSGTDLEQVLSFAHDGLARLDQFKEAWYKRIRTALDRDFQAELQLAYSRARRNEKLLDIEINLAAEGGILLAEQVSHGDVESALGVYDPGLVLVRSALLSDLLSRTREVRVNALGWRVEGVATLVRESRHSIETTASGMVHMFASKGYIERNMKTGRRFAEEIHSKFLVQAMGESLYPEKASIDPYAVRVLRSLAAEYSILQRDEDTRPDELAEYLRLASWLGMLDADPLAWAFRLRDELGGDLGEVKLTYHAKVGPDTIRAAFQVREGALEESVRRAMRGIVFRIYSGMPATDWLPRVGFAYSADEAYRWHRDGSLKSTLRAVQLPPWFTGEKKPREVSLDETMVTLVQRLFLVEDALVAGVRDLDGVMRRGLAGQTVDFRELNSALGRFLESAAELGEYHVNALPAVMDRLIQLGSRGTVRRDSTLLLEATPGKGDLKGKKVTRLLVAATPGDDVPAGN